MVAAIDDAGDAIAGDAFVLASGARSGQLAARLGVRLPMQAAKGYSLTLERPQLELEHPLYLGEARVGLSPFDGALRVAGTLELSGINDELDPRRVESIVRSTRRYLPAAAPNGSAARWMGMRPLLPDGLPALGRLPGWENAWVASGYGMLGITLAPSGARALTQAMLGRSAGRRSHGVRSGPLPVARSKRRSEKRSIECRELPVGRQVGHDLAHHRRELEAVPRESGGHHHARRVARSDRR